MPAVEGIHRPVGPEQSVLEQVLGVCRLVAQTETGPMKGLHLGFHQLRESLTPRISVGQILLGVHAWEPPWSPSPFLCRQAVAV
jgi:hypothetical protein